MCRTIVQRYLLRFAAVEIIEMAGLVVVLVIAATNSVIAGPTGTRMPLRSEAVPAPVDATIASNDAPPMRPRSAVRHSSGRVRLSADVVVLKSGRSLRGAIVHLNADGSLTMAVSREWLRKASAELFAKRTSTEAAVRLAALKQLRDRLDQALVGLPDDSRLAAFLRSERTRAERLQAEPPSAEEPQFVWFDLTKREIGKIRPASPGDRLIAGWSWYERLSTVETRDADDLAEQLRRKGVDPSQPLPDLSDRFPLRTQDDREWSARLALIVYALDKPLDFQGSGAQLVPVDRSANAKDAGPMIAKMLSGQVDAMLKDILSEGHSGAAKLESPDDWLKGAYSQAERQKAGAFRATRVDFNLAGRQASVYSVLMVHLNKGEWNAIWSDRETQDGAKVRTAMEAAITNDPQVKSALSNIQSLGVAGEDQVRQAIRFGAATMAAQQAVDARFFSFEGPLLQHLDGPPLWW